MATSPRGKRLAVVEAPPIPDGWHDHDVIRIIDPLGLQAAWIAPRRAGGVIGYYVRVPPDVAWIEVLAAPSGEDLGCELLLRNAGPGGMEPSRTGSRWELETRDPTSVTVRGTPDGPRLAVTTRCDDDGLHIAIDGGHGAPGDIGLRIRPRPAIAAVEAARVQAGFIRLDDGALAGVAYALDCRLEGHPESSGGAVTFVPDAAPSGFEIVLTAVLHTAPRVGSHPPAT